MKILHINLSSRGAESRSLQLADVFLRELQKRGR
jgi:FMN-dependent NADH-azoreductase